MIISQLSDQLIQNSSYFPFCVHVIFFNLIKFFIYLKALIFEYYSLPSCMGDRRGACKVLMENLKRRDYFEVLFIDWMLILLFIFKKYDNMMGEWTWINVAQDRER